jgi:AmmeMemoRadiSam system protein B
MGTVFMRHPRVAGSFYPKAADELQSALERCYADVADAPVPEGRMKAVGAIIPHAGYVYSGGVAAKVYARLEVPEAAVVLCPNHTGLGPRLSIWPGGLWMTPGGEVRIDEPLTKLLLDECPGLEPDTLAHESEHAIEVHLPFLRRERPAAKFAAIVVGTHDTGRLNRFAEGLARAIGRAGRPVLMIASSDMNHYEDQATTLVKDEAALERVLALDWSGLLDTCMRRDISMCGVAPTAAMLRAAKIRGATEALLVDHRTSGEAFGDYDRVVGYAGVIVR